LHNLRNRADRRVSSMGRLHIKVTIKFVPFIKIMKRRVKKKNLLAKESTIIGM
jgi:hypothetical protein